jgi:hypothetical protein
MILLDRRYRSSIRGGAGLAEKEKERFREITVELSTLALKFEENCPGRDEYFTLHLTTEDEITGLPEGVLESAAALAGRRVWMDGCSPSCTKLVRSCYMRSDVTSGRQCYVPTVAVHSVTMSMTTGAGNPHRQSAT